jgi:hypothetical protein
MSQVSPDKSAPADKPSTAPLAHGDVPEQDGSEDPGVGLPMIRDAELSDEKDKAQSKALKSKSPPSPSAQEHVNKRGGLRVPEDVARATRGDRTSTDGVGEGATVSHVDK